MKSESFLLFSDSFLPITFAEFYSLFEMKYLQADRCKWQPGKKFYCEFNDYTELKPVEIFSWIFFSIIWREISLSANTVTGIKSGMQLSDISL